MDGEYPEVANAFKAAIADADAVLIVTPEYNRSVPGVLKNALDFASRPYGENAFQGKPSAVIGTSIGAVGTAVAQQHLRSILSFLASPELAARGVHPDHRGSHLPEGEISNAGTEEFLVGWLQAFHAHIEKNLQAVSA